MRMMIADNPKTLGEAAAALAVETLKRAVRERGRARLAVSTGISQLDTLAALVRQQAPWKQIDLFQVGERLGAEGTDAGSCRRALRERLARRLPFGGTYFLDGTDENCARISDALRKAPADLLLLGLGDQGQIGFNAAPADFDRDEPYVRLSAGQGRSGEAVSMSIREMLRSRHIIVSAPHALLVDTVWKVVTHGLTPEIPATALKRHGNFDLLLERESAAMIDVDLAIRFNPSLSMYRTMSMEKEK